MGLLKPIGVAFVQSRKKACVPAHYYQRCIPRFSKIYVRCSTRSRMTSGTADTVPE
jgi:hypothetical protein